MRSLLLIFLFATIIHASILKKSTVQLFSEKGGIATATGTYITPNIILSCAHLFEQSQSVMVLKQNSFDSIDGKIIFKDDINDLALIYTNTKSVSYIPIDLKYEGYDFIATRATSFIKDKRINTTIYGFAMNIDSNKMKIKTTSFANLILNGSPVVDLKTKKVIAIKTSISRDDNRLIYASKLTDQLMKTVKSHTSLKHKISQKTIDDTIIATESIIHISAGSGENLYTALGNVVSKKGYVITAAHILDYGKPFYVDLKNERKYILKTVFFDKKNDFAILKLPTWNKEIQKISFNNNDKHVFTIVKNIELKDKKLKSKKIRHQGIIASQNKRSINIKLNNPAIPGNSGAPIIQGNSIIGLLIKREIADSRNIVASNLAYYKRIIDEYIK